MQARWPIPGGAVSDDQKETIEEIQQALGSEFELTRRIGRGAMATVYLAREVALGRLVAIKVLDAAYAADETVRKRFEREARAAASLTHPDIVPVYRFGELADGRPFVTMRYVKGRTLEERLHAEGPLPEDEVRRILLAVARALAVAHGHGIVHRDVRPANVLWDDEQDRALLADFGIAALLETSGSEITRLTQTGQLVGEPRYLSPEQLQDEPLTEQVDIYQFGILAYELLTGRGPYDATGAAQWIAAHLRETPRDLRDLRPGVDPSLAEVLKRCLDRTPNYRPTASDLVRVLKGGERDAWPASQDAVMASVQGPADVQELLRRRVPQIVVLTGMLGLGLMGLVDQLADRGVVSNTMYLLTLPLVACGVAAATVIAWFHGERGPQRSQVLEWILLSLIGVAWLSATAWILVQS